MRTHLPPDRSSTSSVPPPEEPPFRVLLVPDPDGFGYIERRIYPTGTAGLVMAR